MSMPWSPDPNPPPQSLVERAAERAFIDATERKLESMLEGMASRLCSDVSMELRALPRLRWWRRWLNRLFWWWHGLPPSTTSGLLAADRLRSWSGGRWSGRRSSDECL